GIDGVGGAVPFQLDWIHGKPGIAGDGKFDHAPSMGARRTQWRTLPGIAGRDELDLVQLKLAQCRAGQRQVRLVHRVEAAAEQADALHTQSRGWRKSANAASGVPDSGFQS